MRNTRFIVCSLLSLFFLGTTVACSDDNGTAEPTVTISDKVLSSGLIFPKEGGTQTLSILSNVKLEVTSDASWCTVEYVSTTQKGTYTYKVTATANESTDERQMTLKVNAGAASTEVVVKQSATEGLLIEEESKQIEVTDDGGTIEVKLKANGDFQVSIDSECADWISVSPATKSMEDRSQSFVVATNYGTERTGSITFILGGIAESVTVTQAGMDLPDIGMESDAMEIAARIKCGINLGNTLEAIGGETGWGNPVTQKEVIDAMKAAGFNAVRIPCGWDAYIEDQTTYKLKDSWLHRVSEVVGYCMANDMYAILNIHWDGGWLENHCTPDYQEANNKKQAALWTQIATYFRDYDEHLLFAGCNEPNVENAEQMEVLLSYEQTFIDAVRATGGNNAVRNLIVQGPSTDIEKTCQLGKLPQDQVANRMLLEIHYYTPYNFCGLEEDADWGRMFYFWGEGNHVEGSDRNATWGEEEDMKKLFNMMKTNFVDKGMPVILGEYAAMRRELSGAELEAHLKSRADFNECVTRESKNYGMVPFYWDAGGTYGVIDRRTFQVADEMVIDAIMKGASEGQYPY